MAADPAGRARVNRDTLREMMHDGTYIAHVTEPAVCAARDALIRALLGRGISVAVDDTNLPGEVVRHLGMLAEQAGAAAQIADLRGVLLETCIERDARRPPSAQVGAEKITAMYESFVRGGAGRADLASQAGPIAGLGRDAYREKQC